MFMELTVVTGFDSIVILKKMALKNDYKWNI